MAVCGCGLKAVAGQNWCDCHDNAFFSLQTTVEARGCDVERTVESKLTVFVLE